MDERSTRMLLMENDGAQMEMFTALFQYFGADVVAARTIGDAKEQIKNGVDPKTGVQRISVLVADFEMEEPEGNGVAILAAGRIANIPNLWLATARTERPGNLLSDLKMEVTLINKPNGINYVELNDLWCRRKG